jgi:hypothetical protein
LDPLFRIVIVLPDKICSKTAVLEVPTVEIHKILAQE